MGEILGMAATHWPLLKGAEVDILMDSGEHLLGGGLL